MKDDCHERHDKTKSIQERAEMGGVGTFRYPAFALA